MFTPLDKYPTGFIIQRSPGHQFSFQFSYNLTEVVVPDVTLNVFSMV